MAAMMTTEQSSGEHVLQPLYKQCERHLTSLRQLSKQPSTAIPKLLKEIHSELIQILLTITRRWPQDAEELIGQWEDNYSDCLTDLAERYISLDKEGRGAEAQQARHAFREAKNYLGAALQKLPKPSPRDATSPEKPSSDEPATAESNKPCGVSELAHAPLEDADDPITQYRNKIRELAKSGTSRSDGLVVHLFFGLTEALSNSNRPDMRRILKEDENLFQNNT